MLSLSCPASHSGTMFYSVVVCHALQPMFDVCVCVRARACVWLCVCAVQRAHTPTAFAALSTTALVYVRVLVMRQNTLMLLRPLGRSVQVPIRVCGGDAHQAAANAGAGKPGLAPGV